MPATPHILVIAYVWPEPRSSAAGSHMLCLLESFQSRGWKISFASPAQRGEHMVDLASMGIDTQDILLNDASFDHYLSELQPNIVLFDRFMMEEQFAWRVEKHCAEAMRILDTEDLFCLRHARHDLHKSRLKAQTDDWDISTETSPEMLFTELAQREIAAIYRCDLSLIISEVELRLLTDTFNIDPELLVYYPLQLTAPSEAQREQLPSFSERCDFISIGNFRHPPNWDAVLWLKEVLWPEIRRALPKARLKIYGAYTPPKATALRNVKQGFLVEGWAPDALTVMQGARVNLAPLRFGAGLKGKLGDAMCCGTPSAASPIAAEGINAELPFPGSIGCNAEALVAQAVRLYGDEERWLEAQAEGFAVVEQRFAKHLHQEGLLNRVEWVFANLGEHRLRNFIGAMMRHHSHKSTQYMGQWIEAKNKLVDR